MYKETAEPLYVPTTKYHRLFTGLKLPAVAAEVSVCTSNLKPVPKAS